MPESFDIVPTHLAVKAMRDNGYKNAAYSIAELLDNSIQANGTRIDLLCAEKRQLVDRRERARISQIAVLDNGCGMDENVLRIALQFGNGTRLETGLAQGIGRFGMGLPSASISQCSRVEVWSWQDGVESAIYTYLDLKEVVDKKLIEVPKPTPGVLPELWRQRGSGFGKSGTLVVWSKLDRCNWTTAKAIIENSELLIGRMYRKFLDEKKVSIRMAAFDVDTSTKDFSIDREAKANDPLYLMKNTSTPVPWNKESMFKEWGENDENRVTINFRGKEHVVNIRFSYAKEEAREGQNPGEKAHGKHAAKNVGVSVVRAGRELELDPAWAVQYDPRERWWGCEVEFQPGLDEIFGVTNNKQHAHNFAELAKLNLEDLLAGGKSIGTLEDEMLEDEDPRGPLLSIAHRIKSNLSSIRGLIKTQSQGKRRAEKRYDAASPEARATEVTKARQEDGKRGGSDKGESLPPEKKKEEIQGELEDQGVAVADAVKIAETTVKHNLKYVFIEARLESSAFFSVRIKGGSLIVTLNSDHPAYGNLIEVLDKDAEETATEALQDRLNRARDGLKLLLSAWARYEDEKTEPKSRAAVQQTREDWGRIARQFLESDEVDEVKDH